MLGSERLYPGSSYTVRGFKETPVSGDCGGHPRNELACAVPKKWLRGAKNSSVGQMRLFVAYAYGGVTPDGKGPYEWGYCRAWPWACAPPGIFHCRRPDRTR